MNKIITLLFLLFLIVLPSQAQDFDQYFEDNTLRLDYIFAGNDSMQQIYIEHLYKQPQWAGRRARLSEKFLQGNGQLTVRDHDTQEVIYVWTFSTLFQEWLNENEAKQVSRAFECSYNIPYPKAPVDINITLTDKHSKVCTSLTHSVDPKDILIRPIGNTGIPYRYVWKGNSEKIEGQNDRKNGENVNLADCIDLAILAEGYTEAEMDKFYKDCERSVDALFEYEPFRSLKDRFNVVAVAAPSRDSGPSVPGKQDWKNTASQTHYDTFYSDRYLTSQDMHRIYDLLADVPFEHIMVLVNTEKYGGGGIYNQVTFASSDHPTFKEVFVHEFGHSYGGLGDEYAYDDMDTVWYPADTEPWEPNITTLHDFQSKWADMMDIQGVGIFEGAGYQTKGCYRPADDCRMKTNQAPTFCPVCTRAIRRITDFYTAK